MPTNTTSVTSNGSGTGKRKTGARKSATSPVTPKASIRKSASADQEILFKDPPTPWQTPIPPYIWIDHPEESEQLNAEKYVIRMGVGGADAVEISIDRGPWQACRLTSGYWWFDWENIPRGAHTMTARMRTAGGQWYRTPERRCQY